MDRRERAGDLLAGLLAMQESWRGDIWTALPGIIQSFDPAKKTCMVQPAVKAQLMGLDGTTRWVALPLLLDCPVQFPGGGGYTLTFPLAQGDECLVVFASRCIDAWWQSGGIQPQAELRMHDLSDGFCIPGISSVPAVQPAISTSEVQLRSTDGARKVRISESEVEIKTATSGVKCSADRVDITGDLWVNGKRYALHTHGGVTTGGGTSGGVNNL